MSQNIINTYGFTPPAIQNISIYLDPLDIDSFLGTCRGFNALSTNDLWAAYFRAKFDPSTQAPREIAGNFWQTLCRKEFQAVVVVWNRILPQLPKPERVPEFPTQSDIPNWIRTQLLKEEEPDYNPILPFNLLLEIKYLNLCLSLSNLPGLTAQFSISGCPVCCIRDAFCGQDVSHIKLDASQMKEIKDWCLENKRSDEDFSPNSPRKDHRMLEKYSGAKRVWKLVLTENN